MRAKNLLVLLIVLFTVLGCLAFGAAFIVGYIQCSEAGWSDGTWYVVDTVCEDTTTEKLSVIKAGQNENE